MAKFLDQAGLQIVWNAIKEKFIDNQELEQFLAQYEKIEDLQRDYADRTELAEILSGYATEEELERAVSQLATDFVKGDIETSAGKARIFNEADGGGAKFEAKDGTASFVGVNSDTNGGIGAQLYDIDVASNKGSKLDVTKNGIYYTTGDESAKAPVLRDVEDNEIATKKDIKALGSALHYIGMTDVMAGESVEEALARVVAAYTEAHLGYILHEGAVAILNGTEAAVEYIYDGSKWDEFGNEGIYETKAEAEAAHSVMEAALAEEIARATAAEAKKVDKEISGSNGKAYIFNEADGGGAKFVHTDGSEAFVGVNDGGEEGLMAQIYADKFINGKWQGAKIDVTNGAMYYTVGNKSFAERAVAGNEIATKADVEAAEPDALTEEEIREICK